MKVEIELPDLPEGYEYTGEYRKVEEGEYWRMQNGEVVKQSHQSVCRYPVIRKKEKLYLPHEVVFKSDRNVCSLLQIGAREHKLFILGAYNRFNDKVYTLVGIKYPLSHYQKWADVTQGCRFTVIPKEK